MRNRIKEWRENRGLSQQQLADKMVTTQQQVQHLESGNRKVSTDWLSRLANALGVKPSQLIDEEEPVDDILIIGHLDNNAQLQPDEIAGSIPGNDYRGKEVIAMNVQNWIFILFSKQENDTERNLRKLCLVKIKNGGAYFREIRKGSKPGKYMLLPYPGTGGETMEDVAVEWSQRLHAMLPPE